MSGNQQILFPPFSLDTANGSLLRKSSKIPLRPKSLALLRYLLEHPNRLVTKDELMRAVWADTKVLDAALKVSIREIREALGDEAEAPKFIETIARKGYRFIAPLTLQFPQGNNSDAHRSHIPTYVVGRTTELQQLGSWLEGARSGKRQITFVTGEPGIGKTTLVEAFVRGLSTDVGILFGQGQCIEQYGTGEAYMPILDALERLCRGSNSNRIVQVLRQYAPSWLASLAAVIDPAERLALERQSVGITRERVLREMALFLEAMAKEQTVLLVLEDLHWADPSTLSLISFLARRREAARLMLVGTYREAEVLSREHPLKDVKDELQLHGDCNHLPLRLLDQSAVGEYLAARFSAQQVPKRLISAVHRRSEGNPLFMLNVTDYLVSQRVLLQRNGSIEISEETDENSVPATIRQLTERQMERLATGEQELLEAASVAGMRPSAAAVAAGLGEGLEQVENRCDRLAQRQQFLQKGGTEKWPDGTIASRYGFIHALYQDVIYEKVTGSRRARLHHTIGERVEAGHRGATEEVAAELALHFDRAGDQNRAVPYLLQAAQKAARHCGYQEAISYAAAGLDLVQSAAQTPHRKELELGLELLLGVSLSSIKGYAAMEAKEAFSRARTLSRKVGRESLLFQALAGLWSFYLIRAELRSALELGQQMLKLATRTGNPSFFVDGQMATGLALFYLGDFAKAHDHLEKSISRYDLEHQRSHASVYGWDSGVVAFSYKAEANWLLGYPEKSLQDAQKAFSLAEELSTPINLAFAQGLATEHHTYRREADKTLRLAESTIKISAEHGFGHWLTEAMLYKGWALCKKGHVADGIQCLHEAMEKWQAMGARIGMPIVFALQAEAYHAGEQFDRALASVDKGLSISSETKDCCYNAELYRLKGEISLKTNNRHTNGQRHKEAEACFRAAIEISRGQKARSFELRATISLYRLWRKIGKKKEAQRILAKIYRGFTEGFDTPDLKEARNLLEELR